MFYTPASFVSVFLCHPERALRNQRKGRTQDRRTAAGKESCVTYVSSVHCFLLFVLRLIVSFDFFLFLSLHFFPFVTLFFRALFVFVFFCLFYLCVCVVLVTFILHPSFTSSFFYHRFALTCFFSTFTTVIFVYVIFVYLCIYFSIVYFTSIPTTAFYRSPLSFIITCIISTPPSVALHHFHISRRPFLSSASLARFPLYCFGPAAWRVRLHI